MFKIKHFQYFHTQAHTQTFPELQHWFTVIKILWLFLLPPWLLLLRSPSQSRSPKCRRLQEVITYVRDLLAFNALVTSIKATKVGLGLGQGLFLSLLKVGLFLFIFDLFTHKFYRKNCRRQRDFELGSSE